MSDEVKKEEISQKESKSDKTGKKKVSPKKGVKIKKSQDEELVKANTKIAELNDKYLRLYSEFDNYRKRTLKEKTELVKTASEEVITALLPVLDDLERAITALDSLSDEARTSMEGIVLIYNKFKSSLQQKGLEAIDSIGEPFDVDYHEAITNIPAPSEDMRGKVIDEVQKGYLLNGKVIRFARVVVGA